MHRQSVPIGSFAGAPPSQHVVFTAAQLGLSTSAITKRVARGALYRVFYGVYSLAPPTALSQEARWLAAVYAGGEGAVLSHLSAAALWEARRVVPFVTDVLAPRRRRPKGPVRVRECRNLDPRDVTTRCGVPVTTVARMFVDLTDVLIAEDLANVIHEAAFRRRFDPHATREAMQRASGRRNLHVLDHAMHLHEQGSAGLKSGLERAFLSLIDELPEPLLNVHVEGVEVDCAWLEQRVVVELDGPAHTRPRTQREDALKQRILAAAGYTGLRFTDVEIEQRPGAVIDALAEALSAPAERTCRSRT